jgi:anti-sigma factor (TIGR02949 family)
MSHETCRNLLSQLSDYIDGELEEALCAEIEQHMADCPDCQAVVNTLEKTIELYRTTGRVEVPHDVQSRLFKVLKLDQVGRNT